MAVHHFACASSDSFMVAGFNENILAVAFTHVRAILAAWEGMPCGGEIVVRFKVDDDGCAHRKVNVNNQSIDCSLPVRIHRAR